MLPSFYAQGAISQEMGRDWLVFNTQHIFAEHYGKINTLPSQLLNCGKNGLSMEWWWTSTDIFAHPLLDLHQVCQAVK